MHPLRKPNKLQALSPQRIATPGRPAHLAVRRLASHGRLPHRPFRRAWPAASSKWHHHVPARTSQTPRGAWCGWRGSREGMRTFAKISKSNHEDFAFVESAQGLPGRGCLLAASFLCNACCAFSVYSEHHRTSAASLVEHHGTSHPPFFRASRNIDAIFTGLGCPIQCCLDK